MISSETLIATQKNILDKLPKKDEACNSLIIVDFESVERKEHVEEETTNNKTWLRKKNILKALDNRERISIKDSITFTDVENLGVHSPKMLLFFKDAYRLFVDSDPPAEFKDVNNNLIPTTSSRSSYAGHRKSAQAPIQGALLLLSSFILAFICDDSITPWKRKMLVTFYFGMVCLVIFSEYLFNKLIRKPFGTHRSELEYYDIEPKIDPEMEIWKRVGHYATDHTTPIGFNTAREILESATVAFNAAFVLYHSNSVTYGERKMYPVIYAATEKPGHHAGRNFYGGYCMLNNVAIAAETLVGLHHDTDTVLFSQIPKVSIQKIGMPKIVILDLDYHAGDGTHDIFLNSEYISTISIHMDPKYDYPYYRGHEGRYGEYENQYYLTMEPHADANQYFVKLDQALRIIKKIDPTYILISFGADTYKSDPEVSQSAKMKLDLNDYYTIGSKIASAVRSLNKPKSIEECLKVMVVSEGGYDMDAVGDITKNFLNGLSK